MQKLLEIIDQQIEFNKGKNFFLDESDVSLRFINDTVKAILNIGDLNKESVDFLLDYITDKVLQEFYRINQYYTFNNQSKSDLRKIYFQLFLKITTSHSSIDTISKDHYQNLKHWLQESNGFAEKMYSKKDEIIEPVACSEYSPNLQTNILKMNVTQLLEPVLDIGCGRQGNLVNYLCGKGIDCIGIDRFSFDNPRLMNCGWLEYHFEREKWGTIISHLAFSNHFMHHNLREDGNYIEYAKTYMNILHSLKIGGSFHYAPDLPFIEQYLDINKFNVEKNEIEDYNFKATIIRRLK